MTFVQSPIACPEPPSTPSKVFGLLPVGFFTKRGLRVLAAIAGGNLRVEGLIAHPITALRVIALLSVVS